MTLLNSMCSCAEPAHTQSPYWSLPSIFQSAYAVPCPKREGTCGSEIAAENSENLKSVGFGDAGSFPSLSSGMILLLLRVVDARRTDDAESRDDPRANDRRHRPRPRGVLEKLDAADVRHTAPFVALRAD